MKTRVLRHALLMYLCISLAGLQLPGGGASAEEAHANPAAATMRCHEQAPDYVPTTTRHCEMECCKDQCLCEDGMPCNPGITASHAPYIPANPTAVPSGNTGETTATFRSNLYCDIPVPPLLRPPISTLLS